MTQVSRRFIDPKLQHRILAVFIRTLASLHKPEEIDLIIEDLLSPTEKTMLSKRLAIAILLQRGWSYSSIGQTIKVTPPTINKISTWLKFKGTGFRKALELLDKEDFFEDLTLETQKIFTPFPKNKHYLENENRKKKVRRSIL